MPTESTSFLKIQVLSRIIVSVEIRAVETSSRQGFYFITNDTYHLYVYTSQDIRSLKPFRSENQYELSAAGCDFPLYFIFCTDYFHGFLSNAYLSFDVVYLKAEKNIILKSA